MMLDLFVDRLCIGSDPSTTVTVQIGQLGRTTGVGSIRTRHSLFHWKKCKRNNIRSCDSVVKGDRSMGPVDSGWIKRAQA
jgi:hypothetical protein